MDRGLDRRRSRPQPRRGHNNKNFPGIAIPSVIKPSEEMYCFILRISELKKMMEHVNNKWFTFIWDYVKNGNSGEKYPGLSSNVEWYFEIQSLNNHHHGSGMFDWNQLLTLLFVGYHVRYLERPVTVDTDEIKTAKITNCILVYLIFNKKIFLEVNYKLCILIDMVHRLGLRRQ